MSYKEISEILPLNLFDIYEQWTTIDNELEKSDTGRFAKKVLNDAGEQIGRILVEKLEDIISDVVSAVVEEAKEIIEEVSDKVEELVKGKKA